MKKTLFLFLISILLLACEPTHRNSFNGIGELKSKALFSRLCLIGPDGKILLWSKYFAGFRYHRTEARINVKAKLVTSDSKGVKTPLNNALVHVDSGDKFDTIAKTRTDKYGDFELNLPNDKKKYKIKVGINGDNTTVKKLIK